MTDLEAQQALVQVVVDWLGGRQTARVFVRSYWTTRDGLLGSNYSAFDGPVGEILSHMDVALHSFWTEPETEGEIDETQLREEMLSLVAQLRAMGFPVPDPGTVR